MAKRKELVAAVASVTNEPVKKTLKHRDYLKYTFSDAEVLELSKTLAKHNQDMQELEAQKKRVTSDFASKIQAEESEIGSLSRKVCSGYDFRDIDCVTTFHTPSQGKKTTVRTDTGEVVKESLMSHSELQEQLFPEGDNDYEHSESDGNSNEATA